MESNLHFLVIYGLIINVITWPITLYGQCVCVKWFETSLESALILQIICYHLYVWRCQVIVFFFYFGILDMLIDWIAWGRTMMSFYGATLKENLFRKFEFFNSFDLQKQIPFLFLPLQIHCIFLNLPPCSQSQMTLQVYHILETNCVSWKCEKAFIFININSKRLFIQHWVKLPFFFRKRIIYNRKYIFKSYR